MTNEPIFLDVLPGEGETKMIRQVQTRQTCEECGEPAYHRLTFLLVGARSNPASSAYGRDDCTWCSDHEMFSCREHETKIRRDTERERTYTWCSSFPATDGFKHMFLYWKTTKETT